MACGTPVLALRNGSVPEIVEPGVTGHTADDAAGLEKWLPETLSLDRTKVREAARRRFDMPRLVDDYLKLYTPQSDATPEPQRTSFSLRPRNWKRTGSPR